MLDAISFDSSPTATPRNDPAKVRDAARQFEALLVAQMLKSLQDSGGVLGGAEDQSASAAMEYGLESFAQSLANSGGLGLASLVTAGLQKAE